MSAVMMWMILGGGIGAVMRTSSGQQGAGKEK